MFLVPRIVSPNICRNLMSAILCMLSFWGRPHNSEWGKVAPRNQNTAAVGKVATRIILKYWKYRGCNCTLLSVLVHEAFCTLNIYAGAAFSSSTMYNVQNWQGRPCICFKQGTLQSFCFLTFLSSSMFAP